MADRNHVIIQQVVKALGTCVNNPEAAVKLLEHHFQDHLIVNIGGVEKVCLFARLLRLRISTEERGEVLDYIADQNLIGLTVDHVEQAINEHLGEDRFFEP